ncbi:hypothetical protein [Rheinheimera texasensis]|uniref:hypothetical protein n=1 Tax=Rheinheimera texasensis TaxID=306205 RepID=UPI0032B1DBFA
MNDLSIQGSRAYATAYASNELKVQSSSQAVADTTKSAMNASGDVVTISAEALNKFQNEVNFPSSVNSSSSQEAVVSGSGSTDTQPGTNTPPPPPTPPVTTPFNGEGIRPPV